MLDVTQKFQKTSERFEKFDHFFSNLVMNLIEKLIQAGHLRIKIRES